jgi:HEPN domain-containing protein
VKPVTARWLERSERHLGAAKVALEAGYFEHSIFWAQQALEVLLKALLIERSPAGRARRTHDLVSLAEELSLNLSLQQFDFLRDLGEQYSPTRYADDELDYELQDAAEVVRRTKELCQWLQQRLT